MTGGVLALILLTVTLSALAQLSFKLAVVKPQLAIAMENSLFESIAVAIVSPLIWVGLLIYGLSVALWLFVLSKVDLSVAYPFVGISFLLTMAFGAFLLNENIGMVRVIGTLLIVLGCVLIARTS